MLSYLSGRISSHMINPTGPVKNTSKNTKHPDFPLSDASDAAHIQQAKQIINHNIGNIKIPPHIPLLLIF